MYYRKINDTKRMKKIYYACNYYSRRGVHYDATNNRYKRIYSGKDQPIIKRIHARRIRRKLNSSLEGYSYRGTYRKMTELWCDLD